MSEPRKILIADPDRVTVKALKDGFSSEFKVVAARDGSKALELSITEFPDLIMFYRHCPLISAKQFLRILRTNPRTESIPLIILADEALATATLPGYLEGVLVKPLNLDEVRAHVNSVFQRADAAREVGQERGAVQGSLDQISMVDLLQVFSMNRRSGCIRLTGGPQRARAEVFVADGRIDDAVIGNARGEKALYRLLAWEDGTFEFVPGATASANTISAATDSLLMEGMRQGDELARVRESAPALEAEIKRLVPPEEVPEGLHPVTAEIFDLLQFYSRVGDLIDRAKATDLEVVLALQSLLSNELIRVVEPAIEEGAEPLLTQDQVFDVLGRMRSAGLSPTFLQKPKIAVLCESAEELQSFAGALTRVPEFEAANLERVVRNGFGAIGNVTLSRGFVPEVYAISTDERMLPLSFSMSAGTIAVITIGSLEGGLSAAVEMLERERRASVLRVKVGGRVPSHDHGVLLEVAGLDEASVRRMLHSALSLVDAAELRDISV